MINQTQQWLEQIIVKYNLCPFARREVELGSIHYAVVDTQKTAEVLEQLVVECERLDQDADIATTLLILPQGFEGFYAYLDLVDMANALLEQRDYEGIYQVASFHPDYCFEGEHQDDAANYTNRSPYPMLHILREADVEKAIASHPDAEGIPARNIEFARRKGSDFFAQQLAAILKPSL